MSLAAFAMLVGCGFELLDGEGDTDADIGDVCASAPCDGVYAACGNPGNPGNLPSGDSSGGAEAGEAPPHWYWYACGAAPPGNPGCGANDEHCCLLNNCYCKAYNNSDQSEANFQSIGNVCIGASNVGAGFDPSNDWVMGAYAGYDAQVAPLCSSKCTVVDASRYIPNFPGPLGCEGPGWGQIRTVSDWDPSKSLNCRIADQLNKDDPDGSEFPWKENFGTDPTESLQCNLTGDCADQFFPTVRPWVIHPPEASLIALESRTAHYLAGSDSSAHAEFTVVVDHPGLRVDESNPIYGFVEYSGSACGDELCPFFLANLSASNFNDQWTIPTELDNATTQDHTFTNLEIGLLQSALGIENTTHGKVGFTPGAIRLLVEFEVIGSGYGSGHHKYVVENDEYVFMTLSDGDLDFDYTFPIQTYGTAILDFPVTADERPPEALHDTIPSMASCSYTLTPMQMDSRDLDNDVEDEYWVVDGAVCGTTCILDPGTHTVSLVAIDSRGAADASPEQTIIVSGSGC